MAESAKAMDPLQDLFAVDNEAAKKRRRPLFELQTPSPLQTTKRRRPSEVRPLDLQEGRKQSQVLFSSLPTTQSSNKASTSWWHSPRSSLLLSGKSSKASSDGDGDACLDSSIAPTFPDPLSAWMPRPSQFISAGISRSKTPLVSSSPPQKRPGVPEPPAAKPSISVQTCPQRNINVPLAGNNGAKEVQLVEELLIDSSAEHFETEDVNDVGRTESPKDNLPAIPMESTGLIDASGDENSKVPQHLEVANDDLVLDAFDESIPANSDCHLKFTDGFSQSSGSSTRLEVYSLASGRSLANIRESIAEAEGPCLQDLPNISQNPVTDQVDFLDHRSLAVSRGRHMPVALASDCSEFGCHNALPDKDNIPLDAVVPDSDFQSEHSPATQTFKASETASPRSPLFKRSLPKSVRFLDLTASDDDSFGEDDKESPLSVKSSDLRRKQMCAPMLSHRKEEAYVLSEFVRHEDDKKHQAPMAARNPGEHISVPKAVPPRRSGFQGESLVSDPEVNPRVLDQLRQTTQRASAVRNLLFQPFAQPNPPVTSAPKPKPKSKASKKRSAKSAAVSSGAKAKGFAKPRFFKRRRRGGGKASRLPPASSRNRAGSVPSTAARKCSARSGQVDRKPVINMSFKM